MNNFVPKALLQNKLYKLPIATLENPKLQDAINRYHENKYSIFKLYSKSVLLLSLTVTLILSIAPLLTILPVMVIVIIVIAIPDIFLNRKFINDLWKLDKETTTEARKGYGIASNLENPDPLKEAKLTGAIDYLKMYFESYYIKRFNKEYKVYGWWALSDLFTTVLFTIAITYSVYLILQLAIEGTITIGQISFYVTAVMGIGGTLGTIAANSADVLGSMVKLNEIRSVLNLPEEQENKQIVLEKLASPPRIEVRNTSFMYPDSDKKVLNNINLTIEPGEKIAIVGENGAGKTTLVKLISSIYPVTEGEIVINGKNINSIDENSWFKNIGVLYQDFNEYHDLSAFENVVIGDIEKLRHNYNFENAEELVQKLKQDETLMQEVIEATEKSDAYSFIQKYKDEFFEVMSEKYENGTRPSTGQWQKLAIARFFFRNAPLLILDEPTAAIDAIAEANIFDRIYKFIENKTVIIISHRFSTVRSADKVIVLSEGEIQEQGSHEELMANKGMYYEMFTTQAKGYV